MHSSKVELDKPMHIVGKHPCPPATQVNWLTPSQGLSQMRLLVEHIGHHQVKTIILNPNYFCNTFSIATVGCIKSSSGASSHFSKSKS